MSRALDDLPPEGREFKIHLLRRLLDNAPKPLSLSEAMEGGPNRTFASGWYAVKALERIGVLVAVPKTAQCRVARYRLADGAEEVVKDFVTDRIEHGSPSLSPLPASPQYKQVLAGFEHRSYTRRTSPTARSRARGTVRSLLAGLFSACT